LKATPEGVVVELDYPRSFFLTKKIPDSARKEEICQIFKSSPQWCRYAEECVL
jgi:hypothetical protein